MALSDTRFFAGEFGIVDGNIPFIERLRPRPFRIIPRHLAGGYGDNVPRLRQRLGLGVVVVHRNAKRQRTAGGKAASLRPSTYSDNALQALYTSAWSTCLPLAENDQHQPSPLRQPEDAACRYTITLYCTSSYFAIGDGNQLLLLDKPEELWHSMLS